MDTRDMAVNLPQPTLDAGSFVLRPFAVDDLDLVRAAGTDPYIPLITTVPAVFTEAEGMRFIERQWERERQGAGYSFVIADARTGEGVGQIGLWLADASYGRAQVGYWVAPRRRGNGAAGHGLRAISGWALHRPGLHRLELHVEPWNTASRRTAERVGYQREGLLRQWQRIGAERRDMMLYALLREDAMSAASRCPESRAGG